MFTQQLAEPSLITSHRLSRRTALRLAGGAGLAALAGGTAGDVGLADTKAAAHAATEAFANSTRTGPWRNISKSALIRDLHFKVDNPIRVAQGDRSFCGPAAIVYELVSQQPSRYVATCWELFERGSFATRTKRVAPSQTLLRSRIASSMTPADWMLMAAMRDDQNSVLEIDADDEGFVEGWAGITTPGDMEDWTKEVLRYTNVDYDGTTLAGENDALRAADAARRRGGVGFLMIDVAMLTKKTPLVANPNHWVAYRPGNLSIRDGPWYCDCGHVRFTVYSWGGSHVVDLGEGPFEDYMWGVVTGQ